MSIEYWDPVRQQMRGYGSRIKINIFEHQGHSAVYYDDGAYVVNGELKLDGRVVEQDPKFTAVHKDETLTEYTKDGVKVELIEV